MVGGGRGVVIDLSYVWRGCHYTGSHQVHQSEALCPPDFTVLITCAAGDGVTISKDAV